MSQNTHDCDEIPAHIAATQHAPYPEKPKVQEDMEEVAANYAGPKDTMPTGYVAHCESPEPEAQGSGTERYDDPTIAGMQEYTDQSAHEIPAE